MHTLTRHDFCINTLTPYILSMGRLAEYLENLALIYGYKQHIHFMRIRKGSAIAEIAVDNEVTNEVTARLYSIRQLNASRELDKPYKKINQMLQEDNASAVIRDRKGTEILPFPGCKIPLTEELIINEQGSLDGRVIRVGGKDNTVPIWLQNDDREIYKCNTNKAIARELASHLFESTVRVFGDGKWRKNPEFGWELEDFNIQTWEKLNETPLIDILNKLRAVPGSEWNTMIDPQEEWRKLRGLNDSSL